MPATVLVAQGHELSRIPEAGWRAALAEAPQHIRPRLAFMTADHHRIRNFVVRELPRFGRPILPEEIGQALSLPLARVNKILEELERNLFFLWRTERGAVEWAYPVTAARTAHHLTGRHGERLDAAWAEDTLATPFVQGRLRNELLFYEVETVCGHCQRPLHFTLDSDLNSCVKSEGAKPLVFEPNVNWAAFTEPNIIHAFWRNSIFFWSEEHARAHRKEVAQPDGTLLTLAQMKVSIPVAQGALFGFS